MAAPPENNCANDWTVAYHGGGTNAETDCHQGAGYYRYRGGRYSEGVVATACLTVIMLDCRQFSEINERGK